MKIVWTEPAVADLESIKNFIAKDSEYYALVFVDRVLAAIERIAVFPYIGREVPEYRKENIREVLYSNYRIIYEKKDGSVLILAIAHGAREIDSITPWDFSE